MVFFQIFMIRFGWIELAIYPINHWIKWLSMQCEALSSSVRPNRIMKISKKNSNFEILLAELYRCSIVTIMYRIMYRKKMTLDTKLHLSVVLFVETLGIYNFCCSYNYLDKRIAGLTSFHCNCCKFIQSYYKYKTGQKKRV